MNIKENFQKFIDEKRLSREKKIAEKEISERTEKIKEEFKDNTGENENSKKNFSFERIKDAGLVVVAVTLVGIGYVNFSDSSNVQETVIETASENVNTTSSNNLGDVQLVSSEAIIVENDEEDDDSNIVSEDSSNAVTTSSSDVSSYFEELKLSRDNIYSQKLETYQNMIDSTGISSEQKAIAIQEIEEITETQNQIAVAEELIKLKGFENVVIYVSENSVNVIVRSAALSSEQVAQIQNIVTRELGVEVSNISISNK